MDRDKLILDVLELVITRYEANGNEVLFFNTQDFRTINKSSEGFKDILMIINKEARIFDDIKNGFHQLGETNIHPFGILVVPSKNFKSGANKLLKKYREADVVSVNKQNKFFYQDENNGKFYYNKEEIEVNEHTNYCRTISSILSTLDLNKETSPGQVINDFNERFKKEKGFIKLSHRKIFNNINQFFQRAKIRGICIGNKGKKLGAKLIDTGKTNRIIVNI
jgi:hypothetical protein